MGAPGFSGRTFCYSIHGVKISYIVLAAIVAVSTVFSARAERVMIFAAASLMDCLREIATTYEQQTGDQLVFNFASSGILARQIEAGAPADIFFSADEARMGALEKKGLLINGTRQARLSNSLVIVVPADSTLGLKSPQDLANQSVQRIALGNPATVPAGSYAKEYLTRLDLWARVESKVLPTENVRAALAAVEAGNADASIIYRTDVASSQRVTVVFEVPPGAGPRISYPMALVQGTQHIAAARRCLQYLAGEKAGGVFQRYGFVLLEPAR